MRRSRENLSARLNELEAAGCPTLRNEGLDLGPKLSIVQVGGVGDSILLDLGLGAGYLMDVKITNQLTRPVYSSEVELRLPWGRDPYFRWLQSDDMRDNVYRFPGSSFEYPRSETLNEWIARGARLDPHGKIAGVLLAWGGPLPKAYKHGLRADFTLVITDQEDECWPGPIALFIDRSQRVSQRNRKAAQRRPGLFERDIPIPLSEVPIGTPSQFSLDPEQDRGASRGVTPKVKGE